MKIDDLLLDEDFEQALIYAHSLKGACLLAELQSMAKSFHELEDALIKEDYSLCDKLLGSLAKHTLDIITGDSNTSYDLKEIILDQSSLVKSLNIDYFADLPNNVSFDKAMVLRKIFREFIKNSISHSGLKTSNLEISISIFSTGELITSEYIDNSGLNSEFSDEKYKLFSGRGVGLKSVEQTLASLGGSLDLAHGNDGFRALFKF